MTATAEKSRNVYQRKLAVMARCKAITPDKTHPAHKYQYVSIQTLENHLREFCVAEGLDVQASIEDGCVLLTLTNAEKPDEQIVSRWPVVDGDKGWAFSVKFPLMRTFHVGDGDENDESQMATNSGHAATTQAQRGTSTGAVPSSAPARAASSSRPASNGLAVGERPFQAGDPCPTCADLGISSVFAVATGGRFKGKLQCRGKLHDGTWANHLPPLTEDEMAAVEARFGAEAREHDMGDSGSDDPVPVSAYDMVPGSDVDPDDIPFKRTPTADERDRLSGAAWAARQ